MNGRMHMHGQVEAPGSSCVYGRTPGQLMIVAEHRRCGRSCHCEWKTVDIPNVPVELETTDVAHARLLGQEHEVVGTKDWSDGAA